MMKTPAESAGPALNRAWLLWGPGALLLAIAAWRVFTLGVADQLASSDPAAALSWRSGYPDALLNLTDPTSSPGLAPGSVDDLARAAIQSAPLDGRGYRRLAEQALRDKQESDAAKFYALAAVRGPRDLPTQVWLTNRALSRGEYANAIAHLDLMLRVEPQMAPKLLPVLRVLAVSPPSQPALATVLLRHPPWRSDVVADLNQRAPDTAGLFLLINRLSHAPGGLDERELSTWLDRLIRERQWGAAYLAWVDSLDPSARQRIGNVYNGGFEQDPSQLGFDWHFDRVPGARIDRAQVTGAEGQLALRVAFEDRRTPFRNVRELLALDPGRYRLQGRMRLDDLRTERGLVWSVSCAEDNKALVDTDPMRGRRPWQDFTSEFDVPGQGCGGQWLTLRIPARIPAEQLIGGVAWFDDLRVERIP